MKRARIIYAVCFLVLLAAEIYIGMFVHDSFIRPYFGDVLVVILLYVFIRIFFPKKPRLLSLYIFIFAVLVEISQIPPLVDLLGIKNRLIRVLMGTSFAWGDILAYAAGTVVTLIVDILLTRSRKKTY